MSGHTVRVEISTDCIALRFECIDPATCDLRADDGECWPTHYADEHGRVEEFYDHLAPTVPLTDGAAVSFAGGFDVDEWSWRIASPEGQNDG